MQKHQLLSKDKKKLTVFDWKPKSYTHTILLIHGQGEHLGRYLHFGEEAKEKGFRCIGLDLRGHGLSEGQRGHISRWHIYFEDLDNVVNLIRGSFSIVGHSMGGLIALGYYFSRLEKEKRICSISTSAPLLKVGFKSAAWKELMSKILTTVWPTLSIPSGLPLNELSNIQSAINTYKEDPLRVRNVTPRWYTEMKQEANRVRESVHKASIPLFMHTASDDTVCSTEEMLDLARQWPHSESELKKWPKTKHELFQEHSAKETITCILNQIETSLKNIQFGHKKTPYK